MSTIIKFINNSLRLDLIPIVQTMIDYNNDFYFIINFEFENMKLLSINNNDD